MKTISQFRKEVKATWPHVYCMSRYTWAGINTGTLPSHCEKVATYWATLVYFYPYASGRAAAMKYRAVRAFKNGLRAGGLPEPQVAQAYIDTLDLARLKINAA